MDSWRARKLEPGFEVTYSIPSDFRTSTMKSAPGRSVVRASIERGVSDSCASDMGGAAAALAGSSD
jgi:hypothetical protein